MKNLSIAAVILGMTLSLSLSAQSVIYYSYDSAGNRTGRSTTDAELASSNQSIGMHVITPDSVQASFLAAGGSMKDISDKTYWVEALRFKARWTPLEGEPFRRVREQYSSREYALMNHKKTYLNQTNDKNHETLL